jgi:hypothetical protein
MYLRVPFFAYDVAWQDKRIPTFRRNVLLLSSNGHHLLGLLIQWSEKMNIVRSPETSRSNHLVTHRHHLRVGNSSIKTFKISNEVYNKCRNILFVFLLHTFFFYFFVYGNDQYIKHNHQQHELYETTFILSIPLWWYINHIKITNSQLKFIVS